jgi:hypothetical protein
MIRHLAAVALGALGLATIGGCSVEFDRDAVSTRESGSDHFAMGGLVNLTEPVVGDAFLAGGHVNIASEVSGDLVTAGGEVSVGGSVGDDLYAAGGNVKVDAMVAGNARVAGGEVEIGPATVISGVTTLTGGQVEFDGDARGDLQASGGTVRLNGGVGGDAEVRSNDLVIGPGTRIAGKLVFFGPQPPVVPEGAVIAGGVEFNETQASHYVEDTREPVRETVSWVGSVLWFAGVFVAATLFLLVFPGFASRAADAIGREPWRVLGLGLAILVCVPFLTVILLITIVGIPLALLVVPLYLLLLFLGWVTAALFVAHRGLAVARPGRPVTIGWRLFALLLALVALSALRHVPYVGGLAGLVALVAGIGAFVWQAWSRREPQAGAAA